MSDKRSIYCKRMTITIPDKEAASLKQFAADNMMPMSAAVLRAVRRMLAERDPSCSRLRTSSKFGKRMALPPEEEVSHG